MDKINVLTKKINVFNDTELKKRLFLSTSAFFFNSFIFYRSLKFLFCKQFRRYNKSVKFVYLLSVYTLIEPVNFYFNLKISDFIKNKNFN